MTTITKNVNQLYLSIVFAFLSVFIGFITVSVNDSFFLFLGLFVLLLVISITAKNFKLIIFTYLLLSPMHNLELLEGRFDFVISPTRVLLPVLIIGWIINRTQNRRDFSISQQKQFLLQPLMALFLLFFTTTILSKDPENSFFSMIRLAECLISFLIILDSINNINELKMCFMALGISIVIVGVSSIIEAYTSSTGLLDGESRALTITEQPNRASHIIALFFPLLFYSINNAGSKVRLLPRLLIIITILGAVLTYSRGGIIALLVAFAALYYKKSNIKVIALSVLILIVFIFIYKDLPENWTRSISQRAYSVDNRRDVYLSSLKTAGDIWYSGVGFGNFQNANKYSSFSWPTSTVNKLNPSQNIPAHNFYLNVLVENGLLSIIFLLLFWFRLLSSLLNLKTQTTRLSLNEEASLIQPVIACSLTFLVSRLFITELLYLPTYIFFALSISATSVLASKMNFPLNNLHSTRESGLRVPSLLDPKNE